MALNLKTRSFQNSYDEFKYEEFLKISKIVGLHGAYISETVLPY